MILQALTQYYEALTGAGKIARPGFAKVKVSYALEINQDGALLSVMPLLNPAERGKKQVMVPREFELPAPVKRTSGMAANFLWDNASYMLGLPKTDCFSCMADYHRKLLDGCPSDMAYAILRFFETWNPLEAVNHPKVAPFIKDFGGGVNLTFYYDGRFASQDSDLAEIWQRTYQHEVEDSIRSVCLVTGKAEIPQAVHPAIKGLAGAQSSGAALISFNAPAYSSYGKEQSLNAPMGKYAAFAYTSALNYLISETKCKTLLGGMTLLYWAEGAKDGGQTLLSAFFHSDTSVMTQDDLSLAMHSLASGSPVDVSGFSVTPDGHFYILALSPNAARISVRFFYTDTFGQLAKNLLAHEDRMELIGVKSMIPLWQLINATVRNVDGMAKGDPSPHLSGDLLRAVLMGVRYPDTLYQQILLRVRAEQNLTPIRAALIKAYLLKNEIQNHEIYKEVLTVKLNEETTYQPYVLGELFALLEEIQDRASGVTTIKDRYYTSACTTPAVVFPRIIDLAEKHLKKLPTAQQVFYSKELNGLIGTLDESYPAHQSLQDQGIFQIGYYHRKAKRYEKKSAADDAAETM